MPSLPQLFANNAAWAERMRAADPEFFARLQAQQAPRYLWIGCSDSRVPATQIVDLAPGEMFVHRNIANVVSHTDLNCLAVLQYAVDVLHVEHVIVTGHYGCGGVRAVCQRARLGLNEAAWRRHEQDGRPLPVEEARLPADQREAVRQKAAVPLDNWLRRVDDVRRRHLHRLEALSPDLAEARLCELNVIEQARNAAETTVVLDAWERSQRLFVHGWIYGLGDGRLRDLGFLASSSADLDRAYERAVAAVLEPSSAATSY